jgi:hypothetical protein
MTPYLPHAQILADHTLLLALPAFLPAVAVVGVVLFVAMRDRRRSDDDSDDEDDGPRITNEADTNEDVRRDD